MGRGRAGHEKGNGDYVLSREPDYVIFASSRGSRRPKFVGDRQLYRNDAFHDAYSLRVYEFPRPPAVAVRSPAVPAARTSPSLPRRGGQPFARGRVRLPGGEYEPDESEGQGSSCGDPTSRPAKRTCPRSAATGRHTADLRHRKYATLGVHTSVQAAVGLRAGRCYRNAEPDANLRDWEVRLGERRRNAGRPPHCTVRSSAHAWAARAGDVPGSLHTSPASVSAEAAAGVRPEAPSPSPRAVVPGWKAGRVPRGSEMDPDPPRRSPPPGRVLGARSDGHLCRPCSLRSTASARSMPGGRTSTLPRWDGTGFSMGNPISRSGTKPWQTRSRRPAGSLRGLGFPMQTWCRSRCPMSSGRPTFGGVGTATCRRRPPTRRVGSPAEEDA